MTRLACAALVLAGCVHVPDAPTMLVAGTPTRDELPEHFELLCWNIYKERRPGLPGDLARLGSTADVVLLQEAIRPDALPSHAFTMVEAFRFVRGGMPAGVATGLAVAPVHAIPLYSPGREPFANTPKSALATTVRLHGGATLLVINVHGVNFRPAKALRDQLAALDPVLVQHRGPVIVAGDFNTWSRRRADAVEQFADRHDLERVFTDRGAPKLDAVFERGLTVEDAAVLDARSSDHAPLRVRFTVAAKTSAAI